MNKIGGAIRPMILQETLTNAKDALLASPQHIGSSGSQGRAIDQESAPGNNSIDRLLTVAEVAALLNVTCKWVYRRAALEPPAGIPHVKVGKYLRFLEDDLRNYVERLRRN